LLEKILGRLITSVDGAQAAIFLDNDGEAIAQSGEVAVDVKLLGAWKEIHLDHIKEITGRLGLGTVHAVLFSLEEGNQLIAPVLKDYCLLLLLSPYANLHVAMAGLRTAIDELVVEIS
jgi:predicted regulator of Ras-like GTPase activity (Roadblock/LC7/MglB family)